MKRVFLDPVHGEQRIHVELTAHDIRDVLDDDLNRPQFPATQALARIFEEALDVFGRASAAAGPAPCRTVTAPAQLLATAVAELRSVPPGDDVPVPGGTVPARLAEPLAAWLEIAHGYVTRSHPDLATASPFRRGALDVALAVLHDGSEQT